jgi:hypothetical protein
MRGQMYVERLTPRAPCRPYPVVMFHGMGCTAWYLTAAGVDADFVRLEDHGLHGNGHMLMPEKNSAEIAALIGVSTP